MTEKHLKYKEGICPNCQNKNFKIKYIGGRKITTPVTVYKTQKMNNNLTVRYNICTSCNFRFKTTTKVEFFGEVEVIK